MRDMYGFPVSSEREDTYLEEHTFLVKRESQRSEAWDCFFEGKRRGRHDEHRTEQGVTEEREAVLMSIEEKIEIIRSAYNDAESSELASLVELGIPMSLRSAVWPCLFDIHDLELAVNRMSAYLTSTSKKVRPSKKFMDQLSTTIADSLPSYDEIMKMNLKAEQKVVLQIEKALCEGRGRDALKNILLGYAQRNSDVGYCQGMNFIAGFLLLFLSEDTAWKSLSQMFGFVVDYYSDLTVLQADQLVFDELLQEIFPDVEKHLTALGVKSSVVTTHWFLTAFVNALQTEALLRVWDVLIFEGSTVVLIRVALAMVKSCADRVLQMKDSADALRTLSKMPVNATPLLIDDLIKDACQSYNFITQTRIEEMRARHLSEMEKGSGDKVRRTRSTSFFSPKRGRLGEKKEGKPKRSTLSQELTRSASAPIKHTQTAVPKSTASHAKDQIASLHKEEPCMYHTRQNEEDTALMLERKKVEKLEKDLTICRARIKMLEVELKSLRDEANPNVGPLSTKEVTKEQNEQGKNL